MKFTTEMIVAVACAIAVLVVMAAEKAGVKSLRRIVADYATLIVTLAVTFVAYLFLKWALGPIVDSIWRG